MSYDTSSETIKRVLSGKPFILQTIIPNNLIKDFPEAVSSFKIDMELALMAFNGKIKKLQAEGEAKFGASTRVKGEESKSVFLATLERRKKEEGGDFS